MPPLIVDLDGTLIRSDMLCESIVHTLRYRPWQLFYWPFWLMKGKAYFKAQLARCFSFNPAYLPFNDGFVLWLQRQKQQSRPLLLCTAADQKIAKKIAKHVALFDEVISSDGVSNLAGLNKAQALIARFGENGFDYAGNSRADLAVWSHARHAIIVNAAASLYVKVACHEGVECCFPAEKFKLRVYFRLLRMHQWLKNLLLFVPVAAAHQWAPALWLNISLAFFAFSLCASAVYIINDLLDLDSDRLHSRKRRRPFASGQIPLWQGGFLAPLCLLFSVSLSLWVSADFIYYLVAYFALTSIYSWKLKRTVLVDCFTLATAYTLRIITGAAVAHLALSFWLLAFSIFLFLSLAFVKRYAELYGQEAGEQETSLTRGYYTVDAPLTQSLGISSAYASVLVLALYLNSSAVLKLYRLPDFIWVVVPIMLFWISRMWLYAHRGKMHDDPLVFAIKDPISWACALICLVALILGTLGLPW